MYRGPLILLFFFLMVQMSSTSQECPNLQENYPGHEYIAQNEYLKASNFFDSLANSTESEVRAIGLYNSSLIKFRNARYVGALKQIETAVELYPTCAKFVYQRAKYTATVGSFLESITLYNKALELGYDSASIFKERAEAKLGLEDHKGALGDADKLVKKTNQIEDHLLKAKIYIEKKDISKAKEVIDEVIEKDISIAEAHFLNAICQLKNKDLDNSIESYKRAAVLDSKYSDSRIISGIEAYLAKDVERACKYWQNTNKISKPLADTYLELYCP